MPRRTNLTYLLLIKINRIQIYSLDRYQINTYDNSYICKSIFIKGKIQIGYEKLSQKG